MEKIVNAEPAIAALRKRKSSRLSDANFKLVREVYAYAKAYNSRAAEFKATQKSSEPKKSQSEIKASVKDAGIDLSSNPENTGGSLTF